MTQLKGKLPAQTRIQIFHSTASQSTSSLVPSLQEYTLEFYLCINKHFIPIFLYSSYMGVTDEHA